MGAHVDSEIKPVRLSESLYDYAMGDRNGGAGIAIISNDAGGFSHLVAPLTPAQIRDTILAYLDGEAFATSSDVARLRTQCDDEADIEEIAEDHRRLFAEWK
jgi:hypothetical protein